MLEEIGQPYRTELLEYSTTMKAPAYLAVNPMGEVPAIRHGDTVVTEAADLRLSRRRVSGGSPGAAAG
jgi:glutathione S-transferase